MLFVALLLARCSGRISEASECADINQAHLEAGNLQEAQRNMQRAMMLASVLFSLVGLSGRKQVQ